MRTTLFIIITITAACTSFPIEGVPKDVQKDAKANCEYWGTAQDMASWDTCLVDEAKRMCRDSRVCPDIHWSPEDIAEQKAEYEGLRKFDQMTRKHKK